MTREEYEQRKRRLEEHFRAGVELLEIGYRERVRALELIWQTRSGEAEVVSAPPAALAVTPASGPPEALPRSVSAEPRRRRQGAGELRADVLAVVPSLPEVFDCNHVYEALGYQPDRSSLFRVLQQLAFAGVLVIEQYGGGRGRKKYRKSGADPSPGDP